MEKQNTRVNLSIYNLANVAPRVTSTLNIASEDVEAAYHAIITRVEKAGGRIVTSNLNRQKNDQTTGTMGFEVPSSEADAISAELKSAGEVMKLFGIARDFPLLKAMNLRLDTPIELTDAKGRHDIFAMMVLGFRQPVVAFFYILSMGLLCLHLSHGLGALFQSLGIKNKAWGLWIDRFGR